MDIDHTGRDRLYRRAAEVMGREEAETLMASLPPMNWSEVASKRDVVALESDLVALRSDLVALEGRFDLKLEALEHRLTSHIDRALRQQTQWVFGAVVVMAFSMLAAVVTLA